MFITKEEFINSIQYFQSNTPIDYITFINIFKIMYKNPLTLIQYYEKYKHNIYDIRIKNFEEISQMLYHLIITNKKETNEKLYNSYLIIKSLKKNYWNECNILNNDTILCQKNDSSKRYIRNLHYIDLLEHTNITTSIPNKTPFLKCWKKLFENLELDDRYFTPSVLSQLLKKEPIHYFFQQYQPKASIINPYVIFYLLEYYYPKILNNNNETKTILTPVLSWSAYAYAFLQSKYWTNYIGIDVMKNVCDKTNYILQNSNKNYEIYCHPSENLDSLNLQPNIDLIMICPPYYNMEIYETNNEDNQQSITLYNDYQSWLLHYFKKTILHSIKLLKNNGIFCLIIGNYTEYKTKKEYDLYTDMKNILSTFNELKYFNEFKLLNRLSPLRNNNKNRYEYCIHYMKCNNI